MLALPGFIPVDRWEDLRTAWHHADDGDIALGVATGTPAGIWAADGDRDADGDVEPAAASDAEAGSGEGGSWSSSRCISSRAWDTHGRLRRPPDRHDHVERRVGIAGARLAVADDQPEQEDVVVLAQQLTSQSGSDALRIVDEADPLTRLGIGGIPPAERGTARADIPQRTPHGRPIDDWSKLRR